MNNSPTPERIPADRPGLWASKALLSAIEIGVFSETGPRPEPFAGPHGRLGPASPGRPRTSRTLVATGFS